jgi:hypothetical protein
MIPVFWYLGAAQWIRRYRATFWNTLRSVRTFGGDIITYEIAVIVIPGRHCASDEHYWTLNEMATVAAVFVLVTKKVCSMPGN